MTLGEFWKTTQSQVRASSKLGGTYGTRLIQEFRLPIVGTLQSEMQLWIRKFERNLPRPFGKKLHCKKSLTYLFRFAYEHTGVSPFYRIDLLQRRYRNPLTDSKAISLKHTNKKKKDPKPPPPGKKKGEEKREIAFDVVKVPYRAVEGQSCKRAYNGVSGVGGKRNRYVKTPFCMQLLRWNGSC